MVVPADAPCVPWCTAGQVQACPDTAVEEDFAGTLAQVASEVLYWRSGRQWPGACEVTVRPERWVPHQPRWERVWPACGCGSWSSTRYRIPTGPVVAVTEVTIDGEVLDPAAWRVDDWDTLIRTDGHAWPCCGDWTVTYTAGAEPPEAGRYAALILACELAKARSGDETCRLPDRVTAITRQQTVIEMTSLGVLLEAGALGIPEVDSFIQSVNPHGARRPARIRNPDQPRQVVPDT